MAGHRFCFTEPFAVNEENMCESSAVLPSSLGRRCHHSVLLHQEQGMCQAPKNIFPGPDWLPVRTACSADASALSRTELCGRTTSVPECLQTVAHLHCHQNISQHYLGSCHLPSQSLSYSLQDPHPRGSSLPVLVSLSKPWLRSAGAQPALGVPGTCALWGCSLPHHTKGASVTSGAAVHCSGLPAALYNHSNRDLLSTPPFHGSLPPPHHRAGFGEVFSGPVSSFPHAIAPRPGRLFTQCSLSSLRNLLSSVQPRRRS